MTFLDAGGSLREAVGYIDRAKAALTQTKTHNATVALDLAKGILTEVLDEVKKREEFMDQMARLQDEGVSLVDIARAMFEKAKLIETTDRRSDRAEGSEQSEALAVVATVI